MMSSNILALSLCAVFALCQSCKNTDSEGAADSAPKYESGATPEFKEKLTNPLESSVSFGKELPTGMSWEGSLVSLDPERAVWSSHSLRWDWKDGAELTFDRPIPWNDVNQARILTKHFHMVETSCSVWIYNENPSKDGELEFQFYSKDKKVCSFPFKLNFTGWRTARVSFDTEMQGKPTGPMDSLKIVAPTGAAHGTLWLGDIVISKIFDSRHRHGDYQVPYVKNANQLKKGHWNPIMYWYEMGVSAKPATKLTEAHKEAFASLLPKVKQDKKITAEVLEEIETQFKKYHIRRRADGAITGDHIYMLHHLDAAPEERASKGHTLKECTSLMLQIAERWSSLAEAEQASENGKRLAEIFCLLSEHLLDQGFATGSAQGTMHHFGYNTRSWAPAVELMQQPLQEAGLLEPMVQSLIWYYNCNKIFDIDAAVADMDYLNTLAASDLRILSLGEDNAAKVGRLNQFSKWISKMLSETTAGNGQGFKPDGSLFHHNMHYFGYGVPAITKTVINVITPLDGTPFEVSPEAYDTLKKSYIAASYWAYPHAGFNSCGRHPLTASAQLLKDGLRSLAISKPGTEATDPELAQIYLGMFGGNISTLFPNLKEKPNKPMPQAIVMNHNASISYKHDGNTVHLKGWGDSIKRGETYKTDNRYGTYLTHGSMQIFNHSLDHTSGNEQKGWDWSSIPGTTSLLLPHDVLEGGKSFYGKSINQKDHPSGAGVLDGKFGAFLFQLDSTRNVESLTVRKSVFVLGDALICLGSDISSLSDKYPAITTLFQTSPLKGSKAELKSSLTDNGSWIVNSYNTGYYIPDNQALKKSSGVQISHHNKTRKETKGYFNKCWIDHGSPARNATYQYHVLLNATPEKMEAWQASSAQRFQILQQDRSAHHLQDNELKIEALAAFGASRLTAKKSLISSTNHTCIVLAKKITPNEISLSHTNINIDGIGRKSAEAILSLNGEWTVASKTKSNSYSCEIMEGKTILTFSGFDNQFGITQSLTLQKK